MPTERNRELHGLAQRVVDALPPDVVEEAVLTGSVSRGDADELSDIEMLLVTPAPIELAACFDHARAAGLEGLDTWGDPSTRARRVSGHREGVPVELIWWSQADTESAIDSFFERDSSSSGADAIAYGIALRTSGSLARWQERLADYPEALARERIEHAALTWGGYAPAGMLTIVRPHEQLARTERMLDDAARVLRIVYALNRAWQPTHKRLAARTASLRVKPPRLADRIEQALSEPDPRRALIVMTELQAETVALAPDGPNVNRARRWLAEVATVLSAG